MIFQDPYSSLDLRMKVHDIIAEGMRIHKMNASRAEEIEEVQNLLRSVGLNAEHASRYVHEFSGGQRQRIGIARALAVNPEFLLCDEPISALDVSVQAQVVNLLIKLQKERSLTSMFIAHDLSMVNIFPTVWRFCIWEIWWSLRHRENCIRIRFIRIHRHYYLRFRSRIRRLREIKSRSGFRERSQVR